jgi:hypothetical protein
VYCQPALYVTNLVALELLLLLLPLLLLLLQAPSTSLIILCTASQLSMSPAWLLSSCCGCASLRRLPLLLAATAAAAAAGPKSQLDDTVYSQPALYVTNLVALELLRLREPETVNGARVMAGLSLGEYCALVAAGTMSFSDGVKVRSTYIIVRCYWQGCLVGSKCIDMECGVAVQIFSGLVGCHGQAEPGRGLCPGGSRRNELQ